MLLRLPLPLRVFVVLSCVLLGSAAGARACIASVKEAGRCHPKGSVTAVPASGCCAAPAQSSGCSQSSRDACMEVVRVLCCPVALTIEADGKGRT